MLESWIISRPSRNSFPHRSFGIQITSSPHIAGGASLRYLHNRPFGFIAPFSRQLIFIMNVSLASSGYDRIILLYSSMARIPRPGTLFSSTPRIPRPGTLFSSMPSLSPASAHCHEYQPYCFRYVIGEQRPDQRL